MNDSSAASVGRRDFVRSIAGAFVLAAFPFLQQDSLTLGILANIPATGFDDGLRLGLSEASRAAILFGRTPITIARAGDLSGLIDASASVIVGSHAYAEALRTARECRSRHIVYLNCGARSDAFRDECNEYLFHIEGSDAMYANAAKRTAGATIKLWDSSLEKYGAAQLNDRFRSTFIRAMDSSAWCGWFAAKVVWESLLRMKGKGATGIRDHLLSDSTQFDGHKGAPLSFRSWDHQLRQPLYAVSHDRPPQDVPDLGRGEGSIRDLLDSIGGQPKACREAR
ncbi:MAG TPA: hypothetical protein VFD22_03255 [Gemmatimonadaceae bacterium]|nr:hypothetical protein [Gemmatimonadaceae bacterium]